MTHKGWMDEADDKCKPKPNKLESCFSPPRATTNFKMKQIENYAYIDLKE